MSREGEGRGGMRRELRRGEERRGKGRRGTWLGFYFPLYSRFTSRLVSPALQKAELKTISNSNSTIGNMEVGMAYVPMQLAERGRVLGIPWV